jgi:hypothetical protein
VSAQETFIAHDDHQHNIIFECVNSNMMSGSWSGDRLEVSNQIGAVFRFLDTAE